MESKANLAKAVIAVMKEVKGIEKSMQVGSGTMSYKGVPDQEVKKIIGEAMEKNGLCILPIGIEAKTRIDRWEEEVFDNYKKANVMKQKQSVFTETTCKYLLLHDSGESMELAGYGQGVDSQDKSAGKSTTYALKYTLLYTFLVPTGKIDDADNTHSDDTPAPPKAQPKPPVPPVFPALVKGTDKWKQIIIGLADGVATIEMVRKKSTVTLEQETELNQEVKLLQAERLKQTA